MSNEADGKDIPLIIKRKKVVGDDGHHGGAWKVAYADFVTAMMAFFLLMWLLNATTEDQRKGIADFFNPSIPISRISGGGSDGLNGSSIFTEQTLAREGLGASRARSVLTPRQSSDEQSDQQTVAEHLQTLKAQLDEVDGQLSEHLQIKLSPDGIVVEVVDSDDEPLFPVGQSQPNLLLKQLLELVSGSFDAFQNDLKIVGHTDSRRFGDNGRYYDNWDLSADRANTARRILSQYGVPVDRIREVSGKADTALLLPDDPLAAQNRRISLVILTK